MGQCGQGHVHSPIVRPVKVKFSNTEGRVKIFLESEAFEIKILEKSGI